MHQALADLRGSLQSMGGDLVVRAGDPVAETIKVAQETGAEGVALAADVSAYARRRERRLLEECERHRLSLRLFPGVTVLNPGDVRAGGGGHYRVFTPYHRAWLSAKWRDEVATPHRITLPEGVPVGRLPAAPDGESPDAAEGGETGRPGQARHLAPARRTVRATGTTTWPPTAPHASARTSASGVSPRWRWPTPSARSTATAPRRSSGSLPGATSTIRSSPPSPRSPPRPTAGPATASGGTTRTQLKHWQDGLTGVPIVDAGMRQLRAEGWMHNRARLITAAFLTKHLGLDWRPGVQWFFRWLLDGDVPNNSGNWQWTAGTGNDTKPYRRFNPIRQAERFDPDGVYVRRYVPELTSIEGKAVHQPWRLDRKLDYPGPLESHRDEAVWLRP